MLNPTATDRQSLRDYLHNEAITVTKLTRVNKRGQVDKWFGWGVTPDDMKIRLTLYPEDRAIIKVQDYDTDRWDNPRQYDEYGGLELFPWECFTVTVQDTAAHGWRIDEVLHKRDGSWRKVKPDAAPVIIAIHQLDTDTLQAGDVVKDHYRNEYELTTPQGDGWLARNVKYPEMTNALTAYQLKQMTLVRKAAPAAPMQVAVLDTRYLLPAPKPRQSVMLYEPLRSVIDWPALRQAPWIDGLYFGKSWMTGNFKANIVCHAPHEHFEPYAPTEEILFMVCLVALAWMLVTGGGVNDFKAFWHQHGESAPAVEYNRAVMEWHKESETT